MSRLFSSSQRLRYNAWQLLVQRIRQEEKELPICIAGMHRSGTSMVARLLNLCGLYLGPESELSPPAPDNPEGYWENKHFVGINDRILAHLDAGWDLGLAVCKGRISSPT